jgi:hypothetical protein
VYIEPRPALDVYVASFGGWARGSTYLGKAQAASKALEDAGIAIDDTFFLTAGYVSSGEGGRERGGQRGSTRPGPPPARQS